MKSRILVAVLGVPVLIYVVLWAPSIVMMTALCLLAGIGGMELQQCVSGVKRSELVGIMTAQMLPRCCFSWRHSSFLAMPSKRGAR